MGWDGGKNGMRNDGPGRGVGPRKEEEEEGREIVSTLED